MNHQAIRTQLLGWYHARRRRLPWREDPTPYRVWVSEIMLQQTQVATVIPYFDRFLEVFPNVQSLAAASEQEVLAQWSGLGYYRRARMLHSAAQSIVADHEGKLPNNAALLRSLPGIGRYTAGAIASIAFGLPEPVLDGNVARVLARLMTLDQAIDTSPGQRILWSTAADLLDPSDPSSHNQAMMELGALVCHPRTPECPRCPVSKHCRAFETDTVLSYPRKKPRKKPTAITAYCALLIKPNGHILVAKRPPTGLLAGLWELPSVESPAPNPVAKTPSAHTMETDEMTHALARRTGLQVTWGEHLATVDHVFTHRRLKLHIWSTRGHQGTLCDAVYPEMRWLAPESLDSVPLSRLTQKVFEAIGIAYG